MGRKGYGVNSCNYIPHTRLICLKTPVIYLTIIDNIIIGEYKKDIHRITQRSVEHRGAGN